MAGEAGQGVTAGRARQAAFGICDAASMALRAVSHSRIVISLAAYTAARSSSRPRSSSDARGDSGHGSVGAAGAVEGGGQVGDVEAVEHGSGDEVLERVGDDGELAAAAVIRPGPAACHSGCRLELVVASTRSAGARSAATGGVIVGRSRPGPTGGPGGAPGSRR